MVNEPFQLGDWINVIGIEGCVDDIQIRATHVTTKEGREVFIPNALLFTNPVDVSRKVVREQQTDLYGARTPQLEKQPLKSRDSWDAISKSTRW